MKNGMSEDTQESIKKKEYSDLLNLLVTIEFNSHRRIAEISYLIGMSFGVLLWLLGAIATMALYNVTLGASWGIGIFAFFWGVYIFFVSSRMHKKSLRDESYMKKLSPKDIQKIINAQD